MSTTDPAFDLARLARPPERKCAITVLAGGPSAEREISLQSGRAVAAALESLGHTVFVEDIDPQHLSALERDVECVFIALHGAFGEDGQIQEILEQRGIPYCGSAPAACALAMDKVRAKQRYESLAIPTPRYEVATQQTFQRVMAGWRPPLVAKPVKEGSSLACHLVRSDAQIRPAVESVIDQYGQCLIEAYIAGKEITVGILGDQALPPIEIRTRRDFYDYDAKYVDEDTEYAFEIDLPPDLLDRVGRLSLDAHRGLGCRDFSRADWRVDPSRSEAHLLEVNVIPGFTTHSLLPKTAERAGLTLPMMCQTIIERAMHRNPTPTEN